MHDDLRQIYDRATFQYENRQYAEAAEWFARLVDAEPGQQELQLWLARAYYHSAQLGRAESVLTQLIERWPSEAYAHLLLARTLQRAGRAEEGRKFLRLAEAMGLDA